MSVLTPTLTYGSLALTSTPYLWEFGGDLGAPENASQVILSLLADGDVEVSDRAGNRTISVTVLVEGATLDALADAEAALELECRKERNTLTLNPGDGVGAATTFETYRAQLSLVRDDDFEQSNLRRYTLTMRAHPFGRSTAEVTVAALAASGSTTTLVDNGSATTNWTGTVFAVPATPAVVSGKVGVTSIALGGRVPITLTRTSSITTSATKYLVIDWTFTGEPFATYMGATGDGVTLPAIATITLSTGVRRSTFYVAAASIAVLSLTISTGTSSTASSVRSLFVDNIDRSDVRPVISTGRQSLRTVDVAGSARTQAVLSVGSTADLLDVDVYTFADDGSGYTPPLRSFITSSGTTTADAALISGARNTTSTAVVYQIPHAAVPVGGYLIRARLKGSTSGLVNFTLNYGLQTGATSILAPALSIPVTVTNGWQNYDLARVTLPAIAASDSTQSAVYLSLVSTGVTTEIDELWAYNLGIGQLTSLVDSPTNYLFLLSPTTNMAHPRVLRGDSADMSDAFYPVSEISAWGDHEFNPPRTSVFVVTSNIANPDVSLRYFPRWHTHAGS